MNENLKYLADKGKYFKKKGSEMTFVGKELKIYIPKNYADQKLISMENTVRSIGIFRMEIDGTWYSNLILLLMLEMQPSEVNTKDEFFELVFYKDDLFLTNTVVIKSGDLLYQMFVAFLALGKLPEFIPYESISTLFNDAKKYCDINLGVSRVIFEMIYSHIYRDRDDPKIFYRHTNMKKTPTIVALHNIAFSAESNLAKLMGSYMKEGMISSLVSEDGGVREIENMFRV